MSAGASLAHVVTELRRLDLMVRVQAWRMRAARGDDPEPAGPDAHIPDAHIPDAHIPDADLEVLLDAPLGVPPWAAITLPDEVRATVQDELNALAAAADGQVRAAAEAGAELRLPRLARLFGLSRFDVDVLLACLAPELDLRYARLYGHLHDDATRRRLSVDLVLMLLEPDLAVRVAARARFDPDAPLRRAQLVVLGEEPEHPGASLPNRTVELDPRVAAYLLGDDALDERLRSVAVLGGRDAPDPPDDVGHRLQVLAAHTGDGAGLALHVQGDDAAARRAAAAAFADLRGSRLLVVDGDRAAERDPAELAGLVRLADREARLQGALLYWDGLDALVADGRGAALAALLDAVTDRPEPTLLGGTAPWEPPDPRPGSRFVRLSLLQAGSAERLRLWRAALADVPGLDLASVAGVFRLDAGRITAAAATAARSAAGRSMSGGRPRDRARHRAALRSHRSTAPTRSA